MKALWHAIVAFWRRYEHRIGIVAIALGFVFDFFLAKSPDSVVNNILLLSYLFVAGAIIIILNAHSARAREQPSAEPLVLLFILQFCFGGLASNLLVLYGHSGTIGGPLFFLTFLLALVFGNEFLRSRYALLRLNIGLYYILLFTYLLIALPTFVLHAIGPLTFILTAAASIVAMVPFFIALRLSLRGRGTSRLLWEARAVVGAIALCFAVLYFLNVIPPVPLSLKVVGVYHSVAPDAAGNYILAYEAPEWFVFWRDTSSTFTRQPGQDAYCFSSIYAPADFGTTIFHDWYYYSTATSRWEEQFRVSLAINPVRAGGHRAWSKMPSPRRGDWRCDVETAQGALIGRISFTVVSSTAPPVLSTITL